jgi:hypothetical protein
MSDLKMHTANLVAKNIEKLTALFPNCITETRNEQGEIIKGVDFDLLRQELSSVLVEGEQERYTLNWVGKKESILAANAPIAKTLRPCREESVNFDTTENLFIEGDNLDALKLLQENYLGKVKMIYIDPPYNTGKDFIYSDNFSENTEEFLIRSNQIDENGNRLIANTESNGRFHSDWLSMMYSRLRLARNLLTDDGVIFISIDDNEQANLKRICDEIFGEGNFVAELPTIMNLKGNNDEFGFSGTHEHTLVYIKNKNGAVLGQLLIDEEDLDEWQEDEYGLYKQGANLKATGVNAPREKRPNLFFPIFIDENNKIYITEDNELPKSTLSITTLYPTTNSQDMSWRWSKHKFLKSMGDIIITRNDDSISLYKKQRPTIGDLPSKKPKTIFYKPEYSSGNGTAQLKKLFNKKIFNNPKPIDLLLDFLQIGLKQNDLILDFFAGSGTTAHAVMQLNAEDDGNRKFICVQLPEKTDEKSEAFKAGYSTIAEITKERIRRAGSQILQNLDEDKPLDVGFRVLKIDSSNMKDIYYQPEQYDKTMLDQMVSHIKEDRTAEDLLFQVMLDWGIELSLPIERKTIDGSEVYFVAGNTLVACFDKFTMNVVDEIAKVKPLRVVSTELAIVHDQDKTNIKERFKQLSSDTEVRFL